MKYYNNIENIMTDGRQSVQFYIEHNNELNFFIIMTISRNRHCSGIPEFTVQASVLYSFRNMMGKYFF